MRCGHLIKACLLSSVISYHVKLPKNMCVFTTHVVVSYVDQAAVFCCQMNSVITAMHLVFVFVFVIFVQLNADLLAVSV